MTDSMKAPFAKKPTIFYNCLGLIKDAAFLPLCTLDLHTKHETQKQQKWRLKFLTLSNEIIRIVLLPKEHHQSLHLSMVLFLSTNSISLKTAEKRGIAPLLGQLALCTISKKHLHLHSLKPITEVPWTVTQIPPKTARIRVRWLLKRRREQSKLSSRTCSQLTQLFTSFLPLQQSQLNQQCTDHPVKG